MCRETFAWVYCNCSSISGNVCALLLFTVHSFKGVRRQALCLQDAVSRSGRLAQLPAIAEDSQAAAPAATPAQLVDDSLSGPSRATVPAAVLERGLRGALEAQRGLQAGRKRREKLLRALGKVMPVCTLVDLSHATSSALHSMWARGGNELLCVQVRVSWQAAVLAL